MSKVRVSDLKAIKTAAYLLSGLVWLVIFNIEGLILNRDTISRRFMLVSVVGINIIAIVLLAISVKKVETKRKVIPIIVLVSLLGTLAWYVFVWLFSWYSYW